MTRDAAIAPAHTGARSNGQEQKQEKETSRRRKKAERFRSEGRERKAARVRSEGRERKAARCRSEGPSRRGSCSTPAAGTEEAVLDPQEERAKEGEDPEAEIRLLDLPEVDGLVVVDEVRH